MKQAMAWLLQMLNIKGLVLEPARVNNIFGMPVHYKKALVARVTLIV